MFLFSDSFFYFFFISRHICIAHTWVLSRRTHTNDRHTGNAQIKIQEDRRNRSGSNFKYSFHMQFRMSDKCPKKKQTTYTRNWAEEAVKVLKMLLIN